MVAHGLLLTLAAGCTLNPGSVQTESRGATGAGRTGASAGGAAQSGAAQPATEQRPSNVTGGAQATAGGHRAGDGHDHGSAAEGVPHGLSHRGEFTAIQALKGVTPVAVTAAAGLSATIDGLEVVIPPNALTGDAQLRLRRADNSERPVLPTKIPGISFWVDLGGAQIGVDQAIKITGPVEAKFIDALKAKDPAFDPNNYNLKQVEGKWMLTMSLDGPQTSDAPPTTKLNAPFFTTVERSDVTSFPVTWFSPEGPLANTGYSLMGAEGQDHLDGFQTFEDLRISSIQEWLTDEEAAQERFKPLDLTRIKTKDANGNPIELDAGSIDPATGRWRVATGTRSFNPVTHQQNCDFADAGCPDSGAVAKALTMFNHVVTTRFPSDMTYPANLVDESGQPDPRAGQPHPAAGKQKRPPADLLAVVDNYRKIGSSCDTSKLQKVWAKAVWKSDVKDVHLQPAVSSGSTALGPFIDFKGLEGQAGGEVTVGGRIRPVDSRGMAFEWLKSIYNITGYYNEPRNKPAGLIVGFKNVGVLPDGDNQANPIIAYIPRYSPKVQVQLWGTDVTFKTNDQVTMRFKIDDGPEQTAREIIPANENVASALPGEKIPQLVAGGRATTFTHRGESFTVGGEGYALPFEFYAKLQDAFAYPAGKDPARKLAITSVVVKRLNAKGEVELVSMAPHPDSLADARWVPGTPSAGVWLNSRSTCKIRMVNTEAK
jgi:hypothetical protein